MELYVDDNEISEFVGEFIDHIEDMLSEYNSDKYKVVVLPRTEEAKKEDPDIGKDVVIAGDDYDELAERFREVLDAWAKHHPKMKPEKKEKVDMREWPVYVVTKEADQNSFVDRYGESAREYTTVEACFRTQEEAEKYAFSEKDKGYLGEGEKFSIQVCEMKAPNMMAVDTPAGPIVAKESPDRDYPGIWVMNYDEPGQPGACLEYSPTDFTETEKLEKHMILRVYDERNPDGDPAGVFTMSKKVDDNRVHGNTEALKISNSQKNISAKEFSVLKNHSFSDTNSSDAIVKSLQDIADSIRNLESQIGIQTSDDENLVYQKKYNAILAEDIYLQLMEAEVGTGLFDEETKKNLNSLSRKQKKEIISENIMKFRASIDSDPEISKRKTEIIDNCLKEIFSR